MRGSKAPPVSGTKASKKDSRHMTSKSGRYPASGGGPLEHPSGVPVVWVDGVDVTPRSLLPSLSAGVLKGAEVSESAQSEASLFDFKAPPEEGTKTPEVDESGASASEAEDDGPPRDASPSTTAAEAPAASLTADDLEAMVELTLVETETFFLLDMPGSAVGMDSPDAEPVKVMNTRYDELLEKRMTMADMYVESPAQTFNADLKPKEAQTSNINTAEMGTQASECDIYDATLEGGGSLINLAAGEDAAAEALMAGGAGGGGGGGKKPGMSSAASEVSFAASDRGGAEESIAESAGEVDAAGDGEGEVKKEVSLKTLGPALPAVLRIVERMVSQNNYQSKHLQYRHIEPPGAKLASSLAYDDSGQLAASFSLLWSFFSEEKTKVRVDAPAHSPFPSLLFPYTHSPHTRLPLFPLLSTRAATSPASSGTPRIWICLLPDTASSTLPNRRARD